MAISNENSSAPAAQSVDLSNGPVTHEQYDALNGIIPEDNGTVTCSGCDEQRPLSWMLCGQGNRIVVGVSHDFLDDERNVIHCVICRGVASRWTAVRQIRPQVGCYLVNAGERRVRTRMLVCDQVNIIKTLDANLGWNLTGEGFLWRVSRTSGVQEKDKEVQEGPKRAKSAPPG